MGNKKNHHFKFHNSVLSVGLEPFDLELRMALDLVWQQHPPDTKCRRYHIIGTSEEKYCRLVKRYGRGRSFRCFDLGEYFLVFFAQKQQYITELTTSDPEKVGF